MNIALILSFKYPELRANLDFSLRDDGDGPFIEKWNTSSHPEPSKENLLLWEQEYSQSISQFTAAANRVYPAITDQLDMLWHAMDSGEIPKANAWYNEIKAVKDANPK